MAEKMLNSFDIQDSIADDDIVLGYDKSENKVKNFKFGTGIWNWIVDKMTNAVVSKLTTTDKTILGALNELNSKPLVARGGALKHAHLQQYDEAGKRYIQLIIIDSNSSQKVINLYTYTLK